MSAHDRYLANYRHTTIEIYCSNTSCPHHEGMEVDLFSEYGQSWTEPEDCPICHSDLVEEVDEDD